MNVLLTAYLPDLKRVVHSGRIGVYRPKALDPIREDQPLEDGSVCTATKIDAEQLGLEYGRRLKTEFTQLRCAVVFGPLFAGIRDRESGTKKEILPLKETYF